MWALRIASHPNFDKAGQRANLKEIEKIGEPARARRKTSFDLASTDEDRLRMIGGKLRSKGEGDAEKWASRHPREAKWLKASGKTVEDAKQAFDVWWNDATSDDYDCSGEGFIPVGFNDWLDKQSKK